MNPHEALRQIAEIRERMARSQSFRGFASLPVASSGLLALLAAALQPLLAPSPTEDLARYLLLWITVAVLSLLAVGLGLWSSTRRCADNGHEKTMEAVEQVAPSLIVGALLTFFVFRNAPEVAWMLPGIWSLTFALAAFSSRRMLSREILWVGTYFVAAGMVCLSLGHGAHALAPWQMALCFGGGQLLNGVVLYWTMERSDAS